MVPNREGLLTRNPQKFRNTLRRVDDFSAPPDLDAVEDRIRGSAALMAGYVEP